MPVNIDSASATDSHAHHPVSPSGGRSYTVESPGQPRTSGASSSEDASTRIRLANRTLKFQKPPELSTKLSSTIYRNGEIIDETGEEVVCRHLAHRYSTCVDENGNPVKKRDFMRALSTMEGFDKEFARKTLKVHEAFVHSKAQTSLDARHIVGPDQFGEYLSALATALSNRSDKGPSEVNCVLSTADHAISLHMEKKTKDGLNYFAAKVYDPNISTNHMRVVRPTPADFVGFNFDAFVYEEGIKRRNESMILESLDPNVTPDFKRTGTKATAENMHLALAYGALHELDAMLQTRPAINVLRAKAADGLSGFAAAIERNQPRAIEAFAKAVLDFPHLKFEQKRELLQPEEDGYSSMSLEFRDGNLKVIEVYLAAVLGADLNDGDRLQMLEAKHPASAKFDQGMSCFASAIKHNQVGAVEIFAKAVLGLGLSFEHKRELLQPVVDGHSHMSAAFKYGNTEVVMAYVQEVLGSKLSDDKKVQLLEAKDTKGTPGLSLACSYGKTQLVAAFAEGVLSSELENADKVSLLASKNSKAMPGLYNAMQEGCSPTVISFFTEVMDSTLNADQKLELISAKGKNDDSPIVAALDYENFEVVVRYAQMVLKSELSNDNKLGLLNAKWPDGEGCLSNFAQTDASEKTAAELTAVVQGSSLTPAEKYMLLEDVDVLQEEPRAR